MSTIKVDTVRPVTTDASLTLQGDSSGSGVTGITIDSAGDVTISGGITFSQDITGTLSSSSNIKAPLNASGSAPVYACRAWVNFDGTGTVAIRASGNVSSITDNGTGDYTVNFTTAMPDANYSIVGSGQSGGLLTVMIDATAASTSPLTTTSVPIALRNQSSTNIDTKTVTVAIFR